MPTQATIGLASHRTQAPLSDRTLYRSAPLSDLQRERALGALVGAAAGDALGAPYEFEPPIAPSDDVAMIGGGHFKWDVGEWTDDTAMALVILDVAADPSIAASLTTPAALDEIAAGWYRWSHETVDIGRLTAAVMERSRVRARAMERHMPTGEDMHVAARDVAREQANAAGNGALMRVHAIVLPYLRASDDELFRAVVEVSTLTHVDPDSTNACVLWAFALRHAILTGEINVERGLAYIPLAERPTWQRYIEEARSAPPAYFSRNGWVIHAFQAAISVLHNEGPIPSGKFAQRDYMSRVLESAVRCGYDTDTLASITGALAGGALGIGAIDPQWRRVLHGWPGYDIDALVCLGERVIDLA